MSCEKRGNKEMAWCVSLVSCFKGENVSFRGSNYSNLWFEWQKLTICLGLSGFTSSMDALVSMKRELTRVSGLPLDQQNPFAFFGQQ